jgi:hypothetical protein
MTLMKPHLKEYLAVDGPVSGGSATVESVIAFLPKELRDELRDATHFEAAVTLDDDFVVFAYTPEELARHHITDDVSIAGELRIALIDVPYVKRDIERSVGNSAC